MKKQDAVTALILEVFRTNGDLIAAGDSLVADLQLSSARWQVLGAIALSPQPLSVASIARNMGLTRQAVQRIVNLMEQDGSLRFEDNPHHQRAKLVLLTAKGKSIFAAAMKRQLPWAAYLADGLRAGDIVSATAVLRHVRERLETKPSKKNSGAIKST